jgi:hypothetical protein
MDGEGRSAESTPIDIDPLTTTPTDYVLSASRCPAVIAYREDISQVARVFWTPAVRQPYLRAVAEWVRSPGSGYEIGHTWQLFDLPAGACDKEYICPSRELGRSPSLNLTVDLFIRTQAG